VGGNGGSSGGQLSQRQLVGRWGEELVYYYLCQQYHQPGECAVLFLILGSGWFSDDCMHLLRLLLGFAQLAPAIVAALVSRRVRYQHVLISSLSAVCSFLALAAVWITHWHWPLSSTGSSWLVDWVNETQETGSPYDLIIRCVLTRSCLAGGGRGGGGTSASA
jgi:hypothetical protein